MHAAALPGYCQYPASTGEDAFVCRANEMIAPRFSWTAEFFKRKAFWSGVNIDSLLPLSPRELI